MGRRLTYYLFLIWLAISAFPKAGMAGHPLRYDSTVVTQIRPETEKEKEVFGNVDLSIAKDKEHDGSNPLARFFGWLIDSIFGDMSSSSLRALYWGFIGFLILIAILMLWWLFSRGEMRALLHGNSRASEFNFSDVEEDISGIDFDQKIGKAREEQDYRLAVRWLYLKQMHLLNESSRIIWKPYKTNLDYALELKDATQREAFRNISRIYEYVWYGKYTVDPESFGSLEKEFSQFEAIVNV